MEIKKHNYFMKDNTNGEYTDAELEEMNARFDEEISEYAEDSLWDPAAKNIADKIMNSMDESKKFN